jgi:hypothetical protein
MEGYKEKLWKRIEEELRDLQSVNEMSNLVDCGSYGSLSKVRAEFMLSSYEKFVGLKRLVDHYVECFGEISEELVDGVTEKVRSKRADLVKLLSVFEGIEGIEGIEGL